MNRRITPQPFAVILLFALALAVSALPALAQGSGQWVASYQTTGSIVKTTTTTAGQTNTSTINPPLHHTKAGGHNGYVSASLQMQVTVTATLMWVDSWGFPAPNPPARAMFLEQASASGENLNSDLYAGTANNGLGNPSVDEGDIIISSGKHLIQRDGSSGIVVITRTLSASIACEGDGAAYCMVDWGYTVTPDTRRVTLWRQGARGEIWDGDGTVYGHSVFSYYQQALNGLGELTQIPMNLSQTFDSSFVGNWTMKWEPTEGDIPDVTWEWSPSGSNETWQTSTQAMLEGTRFINLNNEWDGPFDTPQTMTFTYTATDNGDGAKAVANYVLILHDVLEANYPDQVTPHVMENLRPHPFGGWAVNEGLEPTTITVGVTQGYTWALSVQLSGTTGKWMAGVLGINITAQYTCTTTATTSIAAPNVPRGYGTRLMIADVYDYHDGFLDEWDQAGYVGKPAYQIKVPNSTPWAIAFQVPYVYFHD